MLERSKGVTRHHHHHHALRQDHPQPTFLSMVMKSWGGGVLLIHNSPLTLYRHTNRSTYHIGTFTTHGKTLLQVVGKRDVVDGFGQIPAIFFCLFFSHLYARRAACGGGGGVKDNL